ncbi:ABC transporter substrate-binding protein [Oryzihumus sp.]|jgi:polar amino acid transport system substrate-binding protein|uniref:ABC transporter substrate-binding protein n=1 Tax=Oryzihumus sp. TaxID=1968903 RepID=UPI002ED79EB7
MTRPSPAILRTAVGVAVASLALSACGSNSLSSGGSSTSSGPAPTATKNAALAAKLPAKIKSAGEIVVGTDATYAPNEFLATDGKTVQGMDVDLFNAVAQEFGVKVKWVPANFDSIILGVDSGKYDMGISSFSITDERKKQVNMVSYYTAGTQWVTAKGNPKKVNPDDACGLNVAVQKATTQLDDITARNKKCTSAGKKAINIVVEVGQDKVTADVTSGKADAMLADSPVALYAVKQTGGQLEAVGSTYDSAPYGYVIPKSETDFGNALVEALKQLDSSGGYKQALAKWGIQTGAINNFALNP